MDVWTPSVVCKVHYELSSNLLGGDNATFTDACRHKTPKKKKKKLTVDKVTTK